MSALNAEIGNFQILSFGKRTEQRKNNAELIEDAIKNKVGIRSILPDKKSTNTYLRLPMICDDRTTRDKWITKLKSKGLWGNDKLYDPIYMFTDDKPESFPLFNSIKEKIILITTHPYINKKDIENLKPVNLD
jgi:dTDP-4-amino-4,6-dideoxygalactose transaminase